MRRQIHARTTHFIRAARVCTYQHLIPGLSRIRYADGALAFLIEVSQLRVVGRKTALAENESAG